MSKVTSKQILVSDPIANVECRGCGATHTTVKEAMNCLSRSGFEYVCPVCKQTFQT